MLHVHQNFIPWIVKVLLLKLNYCWYVDQAKKIDALHFFSKRHISKILSMDLKNVNKMCFIFLNNFLLKKIKHPIDITGNIYDLF